MHLVTATDEQKRQRDALTYSEWGKLLSPEGYAAREQRLRAHPWSRSDMRTWLLCGEDGGVLASCETFRTDCFLRSPEGPLVPGDGFAIASVFTEERLRGQGYATLLMDLLAAELERQPRAQAALLFSDVGPRLYARSGYQTLPAWDWHLPPTPGDPSEPVDALLREEELGPALGRMRHPEAPFFFWPTQAQLDWQLERGRIYVEYLGCSLPASLGATAGASTILWGLVGGRSADLTVLMLDMHSPSEGRALLEAARREASRSGLSRVVLWEEPAQAPLLPLLQGEGASRVARDGCLPMVRALRPGLPLSPLLPVPRGLWV